METPEAANKRFDEIAMTKLYDISGVGERIQSMSTDRRLTDAVYDDLIAQLKSIVYSDSAEEEWPDTTGRSTIAVAAHLQHEYGLDDENTLKAIELARLDLQEDKQLYD